MPDYIVNNSKFSVCLMQNDSSGFAQADSVELVQIPPAAYSNLAVKVTEKCNLTIPAGTPLDNQSNIKAAFEKCIRLFNDSPTHSEILLQSNSYSYRRGGGGHDGNPIIVDNEKVLTTDLTLKLPESLSYVNIQILASVALNISEVV